MLRCAAGRTIIATMQVLSAHAESAGDLAAIRHGLKRVGRRPRRVHRAHQTGNRMADAILGSKISLVCARIPVTIDAHALRAVGFPGRPVRDFGQPVRQCIEATLPLPGKRMIRIYIDTKNTQLYISFTNTAAGGRQEKWAASSAAPRARAAAAETRRRHRQAPGRL